MKVVSKTVTEAKVLFNLIELFKTGDFTQLMNIKDDR
ncbi:hypothetical protein SAMN05443252_101363 [Bacillus sp. OV322]|nr:hypothetical protein SAMN05443252_101363 [Bacillus sp. OV322]